MRKHLHRSELRHSLLALLANYEPDGLTPPQISLLLLWSPQRVADILSRSGRLVVADAAEVPRWHITQLGMDWLTNAAAEEEER